MVALVNEGIAATVGTTYSRQAYARRPAAAVRDVSKDPAFVPPPANGVDGDGVAAATPAGEDGGEAARRLRENMEQPASRLPDVVEAANFDLKLKNHSLRFRITEEEVLQIQIVDTARDKIIRSIPADDMIVLANRMHELFGVGAMVDHSR